MIGPSSWFFPQASHARRAGKMQEEVSFANVTDMSGTPGAEARHGQKKHHHDWRFFLKIGFYGI